MAFMLPTVIFALVILFIFHKLLNIKNEKKLNIKNKKKLPPGPKGLPILGHLHLLGENPTQDFYKLSKKHGPIMYLKLGLVPTYVISSPESAEKILKTYDHVFASRPHNETAQYISYGQRNLIFSKYGAYWRNMRKLCTVHLLSNHKINSYRSTRSEEVALMIKSIKPSAQDGVVVDLSAKVSSLSANLSCLMVFGKKFMDEDLDKRGFKSLVQEVTHLAATPNLGDFFPFFGVIDIQGLTRRMKDISKVFDEFVEKIIDEHVQTTDQKKTKDFVDTMMSIMQSGEAEFQFDRRHVKAVLLDMLVASIDTSSTSVEWMLSELLKNPNVMEKLQKELEEVVVLDRMVEESDLDKLKYLNMVFKESFRLHAAAPLLLHEAMEDCMVDDFYIQKGSQVIVNSYSIHMDPNVWPEADKFLPERFLESNVDVRGRDFQLLPFGSGRRSCPGMHLALIIVRLVVAQLVHCFDWKLPNGIQPKDLDMTEKFGIVTGRAKNLMAIPTYRLHN
ncbi:cytochrome P450 71AU50-like [Nicotiana tomentosiformis]|uniref:cytochrome P450 71AU50-like n=1 Tax=Nicotiana tomentosiformis TaxID=4098 RepID=UPI00051AD274|nr:cytochrome P450 CYP736A12-like [Nicotiana tomentosiformis]